MLAIIRNPIILYPKTDLSLSKSNTKPQKYDEIIKR